MVFDQGSVQAARIRKEANHEGARVTLLSTLDGARCSVQIEVGYSDAVTPVADILQFPALLENVAPPPLRAYPMYTVIAEK
ncbi:nucleotidyl transferase AbiEii/AbiGii toxin family protein [Massilia hydrophila]|uniref:nucleotidyl transferase AbiEii/AbiGii toxin family protein n=1 Tax=Massilia hydrophila TaxID=3044279 RepID=UPI0022772DC5|nr:nucleotidyl transferase AbiEii/AbiGii toxin family protein [Massilia oculi]